MYCQELKQDFANKDEMFKALKSNKSLLVKQKKSEIKKKVNVYGQLPQI